MLIRQLFIDARRCKGKLNDKEQLTAAMQRGIDRVGAQVVGDCIQTFVPHGVTVVFILAESHFIVSTWPEYDYATVDILLCNEAMDPLLVWQELREILEPEHAELQRIVRSVDGTAETPCRSTRVGRYAT